MNLKQRLLVLAALGVIGGVIAYSARVHLQTGHNRAQLVRLELDDAWHSGNYARAAELFTELQTIEPGNLDNYVDQAFALHSLGRDDDSLDAYARGIKNVPQAWYIPFHRGYQFYYRWHHDPVRALQDLETAAALVHDPTDTVLVMRQKANLHAILEQWEALRTTSERILAIEPANRFAQRDLDRLDLRAAWDRHDRTQAQVLIGRLQAFDPGDKVAADYAQRLTAGPAAGQ